MPKNFRKGKTMIGDCIGIKFNRLIVLEEFVKLKITYCKCLCDCGNIKIVRKDKLKNEETKSCGCYRNQRIFETCHKTNKYNLNGEYGVGYSNNSNKEFYFDLEDYDKIKDYCWCVGNRNIITATTIDFSRRNIKLHRLVMGVDCNNELEVDHINRNSSDNRKCNLRICEHSKNMMNVSKRIDNTSGISGISWDNSKNKWHSYLTLDNKRKFLGRYKDKEQAIIARLKAEKKYFGEFAPQKHLFDKYNI